jgi:hypothetical protein
MKRIRTIAAALAIFGVPSLALTQSPAPDPKACSPGERLQPGERGPKPPAETKGENLSEKLSRTEGVICPPSTDPDIRVQPPNSGKTPVIPPPGTPGGDQSIRPK